MEHSFHHRSRKGGALKVILIVVGVLFLLGVVGVVAIGWFAKSKIDEAGGMEAFAGKMMGKGLEMMKPEVDKALNPTDQKRFADALALFQEKSNTLSSEQIQSIGAAVQGLSEKSGQGTLSEADAKAFVDELTRILNGTTPTAPAVTIPEVPTPSTETVPDAPAMETPSAEAVQVPAVSEPAAEATPTPPVEPPPVVPAE